MAICAVLALWAPAPGAHAAVENPFDHSFDPVLSLEGDCNGEDGAADPGCPYSPPPLGPQPFQLPCGSATDPHGDIYVANPTEGTGGRIDVFDPKGQFLAEIPNTKEPCRIAVDSAGNLYVIENTPLSLNGPREMIRYEPSSYPPEKETTYTVGATFEFVAKNGGDLCSAPNGVAIDPSNDHLYVSHLCRVEEYGSAAEGTPLNPLFRCCIGEGPDVQLLTGGLDVYGANHDVYVTEGNLHNPAAVLMFDATGNLTCTLEGGETETPSGEFDFEVIGGAIAVDQADGELYVVDLKHRLIDQFQLDGNGGEGCPQYSYAHRLPEANKSLKVDPLHVDVGVDASCRTGLELSESCNVGEKYDSPNEGEVFLTTGTNASNSHLYAFKPKVIGPPEVRGQTANEVGETEAVLEAELNPQNLETRYHFEYVSQAEFEANGYVDASRVPIPDGEISGGVAFTPVTAAITGLGRGVDYRFRLVGSNCEAEGAEGECLTLGEGSPGSEGKDGSFATYASPPTLSSCPNAALRTGSSATLPDCRAYELVTPADTNGRVPNVAMLGGAFGDIGFDTALASAGGESVIFGSHSGALPGIGGGGLLDTFEARRGEAGWQSHFTGVSGAQGTLVNFGGISPDHLYSLWEVYGSEGSLADPIEGRARYLRVPPGAKVSPNCAVEDEPEGRFQWLGCGSLGVEPRARGSWITAGGDHVIFSTDSNIGPARQLEENCAASGAGAIYDRAPGGTTHCVSLLPGDITPAGPSTLEGISADGSTVAFKFGALLYARIDDAETVEVAAGGATFGGISANGDRVFYLQGDDIFACDLATGGCAGEGAHAPMPVGSGNESTLVNVSADGSHVYFVSRAALTGEEENEQGITAKAGEENLYVWNGSAVGFIAIIDSVDVSGEGGSPGLGNWVSGVLDSTPTPTSGPANDPSRTTPNGSVFVFESRAELTGYASGGHGEVYRYAAAGAGKRLRCVSCNPTGVPAASDAQLESLPSSSPQIDLFPPTNALSHIANVSVDGRKVFFQSADRLVSGDGDGRVDIYEWEAQGEGGCEREAGCLSLISSGSSKEDDYLYAMTPDGSDVFFLSSDTLIAQDPDNTPSIYDARVDGGFQSQSGPAPECLGEACQPTVAAPEGVTPNSASFKGPGNPGYHKKRGGRHHKKRRHQGRTHRRTHAKRGAAR